ncbi:MAG: hypothetical protein JW908_03985 [Anaerolineales bacterium]|nr:hypothetical protein [Anaerolineales bacterium]
MITNLIIKLDGLGGASFCVGDDPDEGILTDTQRHRFILMHSLDDFWLRIRNR